MTLCVKYNELTFGRSTCVDEDKGAGFSRPSEKPICWGHVKDLIIKNMTLFDKPPDTHPHTLKVDIGEPTLFVLHHIVHLLEFSIVGTNAANMRL